MPFDPRKRPLTTHEARVLGTLMEKARTVPDSYPLTLNSLLLGCNQKTSREPVMELSEAQVQEAIDSLAQINLSTEAYGSRAKRYGQQFQRIAGVTEPQSVIVGLLLLRGPQTVAELRINGDRWYKFADNGAVEEVLNGLVAFDEQTETGRNPTHGAPLVVQLPKAAGSREARWMHLLSGEVDPNLMSSSSAPLGSSSISHSPAPGGTAAHTIASLEARVTELEAIVAHIQTELGLKITPKE
jgi:uncharacterized protein